MRPRSLVVTAVGLGMLFATPARADWRVVARQHGVEVSEEDSAGSSLPRFRGVGEVAADPDEIVAVIRDVAHQCEWMPDCAETRVVRSERGAVVVYRRTDAPWPVSDRDVLLRSTVRVVKPGQEIHIQFSAVDDPAVPPREGAVRMPRLSGWYKVRGLAPGRSELELEVHADPGGSFPAWLAARTARDNPVRTIVGLRERLAR